MVPLSIYNKKGLIKLKFGLAKGRKKFDKREIIKKREDQRRMRRHLST
jgi:SsrA-binding protein